MGEQFLQIVAPQDPSTGQHEDDTEEEDQRSDSDESQDDDHDDDSYTLQECSELALLHQRICRVVTLRFLLYENKVDFDPFWTRDLTDRLHSDVHAPLRFLLLKYDIAMEDFLAYTPLKVLEQFLTMPTDNPGAVHGVFRVLQGVLRLTKDIFTRLYPIIKSKKHFTQSVCAGARNYLPPKLFDGPLILRTHAFEQVTAFAQLLAHLVRKYRE